MYWYLVKVTVCFGNRESLLLGLNNCSLGCPFIARGCYTKTNNPMVLHTLGEVYLQSMIEIIKILMILWIKIMMVVFFVSSRTQYAAKVMVLGTTTMLTAYVQHQGATYLHEHSISWPWYCMDSCLYIFLFFHLSQAKVEHKNFKRRQLAQHCACHAECDRYYSALCALYAKSQAHTYQDKTIFIVVCEPECNFIMHTLCGAMTVTNTHSHNWRNQRFGRIWWAPPNQCNTK